MIPHPGLSSLATLAKYAREGGNTLIKLRVHPVIIRTEEGGGYTADGRNMSLLLAVSHANARGERPL